MARETVEICNVAEFRRDVGSSDCNHNLAFLTRSYYSLGFHCDLVKERPPPVPGNLLVNTAVLTGSCHSETGDSPGL